jgi:hypothetical protein
VIICKKWLAGESVIKRTEAEEDDGDDEGGDGQCKVKLRHSDDCRRRR